MAPILRAAQRPQSYYRNAAVLNKLPEYVNHLNGDSGFKDGLRPSIQYNAWYIWSAWQMALWGLCTHLWDPVHTLHIPCHALTLAAPCGEWEKLTDFAILDTHLQGELQV